MNHLSPPPSRAPAIDSQRAPTAATELRRRLLACAPFAALDSTDIERLVQATRLRRLAAGEALWRAGQEAAHVAVIESGTVQIRQMTPTGEGVVLGLFGRGDTIGLSAVLERGSFPADAIALAGPALEVLWVRADALLKALPGSAGLGLALNHALVRHAGALRAKIDIVSAGSVPRRLAALLHHLLDRFGERRGDHAATVEIILSREEIGQLVSARVETVSRILSRWQKAGWLRTRTGGFDLLRVDMLERILDPASHPGG